MESIETPPTLTSDATMVKIEKEYSCSSLPSSPSLSKRKNEMMKSSEKDKKQHLMQIEEEEEESTDYQRKEALRRHLYSRNWKHQGEMCARRSPGTLRRRCSEFDILWDNEQADLKAQRKLKISNVTDTSNITTKEINTSINGTNREGSASFDA